MYIEIQNISKKYGKKQILSDVNLNTESGKCIGILGGNGCGKSTLFSILAGVRCVLSTNICPIAQNPPPTKNAHK